MLNTTVGLSEDFRSALRTLRHGRGFAAVVVLTLALGVAASVTIFSSARALVDGAIPFPEADQLLSLTVIGENGRDRNPRFEDFAAWSTTRGSPVALTAVAPKGYTLGDGSRTTRVTGARATPDYFSVLAVSPLLGRTFSADEARGGDPVVVISHRLWQTRFAADPAIVGRVVSMDGESRAVIGVIPEGLGYPGGADLWVPLAPGAEEAATLRPTVLGRLRDGATAPQVEAVLGAVQVALGASQPADERATRVRAESLVELQTTHPRRGIFVFQLAAGLVLLIGCANAAGLMLIRSMVRERELAVRRSLGASPAHISRQLLTEGLVLALAAGMLGTLLAVVGVRTIRVSVPPFFARSMLGWERLAVDMHALGFALGISVVAGIAFAVPSVLRAVRLRLAETLKDGSSGASPGRRWTRATNVWVAGEVAVSLVLLVCAGLVARNLFAMVNADPGFRSDGVLSVEWSLPPDHFEGPESLVRFQDALLERMGTIPGAGAAAITSNLPMSHTGWSKPYRVEGTEKGAATSWRPITPGYLDLLEIPVLRGRPLLETDDTRAPRVALVSERLAERHWPDGGDPIGQRIIVDGESWTIVGIAGDVHNFGVANAPDPLVYVPQRQAPSSSGFLAIPLLGDAGALAARIHEEIWRVEPSVAVGEVRTMEQQVRDYYGMDRMLAVLLAVFAAVSLAITLVSLYTALSYRVTRHRREIGIRLALGARTDQILRQTIRQGLVLTASGGVAGTVLALGAGRLLAAMLYGVEPIDGLVFTVIPGGLLLISALASLFPARRAAGTDPMRLLRRE